MEIELFKVYELNDYGKKVIETDKIFVALKSSIDNYYVVLHEDIEGNLLKSDIKDSLIRQIVK